MFLLYDTETTGLITSFDQITEFAAIAYDKNFSIINQYTCNIRLMRDSIPALEALAVTPNLPSILEGLQEPEAMRHIHNVMASQPWNGGYNTMRFDDELLRFSFYRNGLNPYRHQNPKISTRFDLLPIIALFYLIHPSKLSWPKKNGVVSLKLELLNQANNWKSGQAHRALFDVEMTAELMKALATIDRPLLEFALNYSNRETDQQRCKTFMFAESQPWAYLLDPRFGPNNQYIQAYYYQGQHPLYANQTLWQSMTDPERILRKKWGEAPWVMPKNILKYLEEPVEGKIILPYQSYHVPELIPATNLNKEADLYANTQWSAHNCNSRSQSPVHLWRYDREKARAAHTDFSQEYNSYLLEGTPPQGNDHLGRARRHMQSIDPIALENSDQEIKKLYKAILENITGQ